MRRDGSALEVLLVFLRLGLTSFGGPVAHLGYFRADIVERRRWLEEASYADIVALCQFLPCPASSQVAISPGVCAPAARRARSLVRLQHAFGAGPDRLGYGVGGIRDLSRAAWMCGLKIVAVAVVANAVWGIARKPVP